MLGLRARNSDFSRFLVTGDLLTEECCISASALHNKLLFYLASGSQKFEGRETEVVIKTGAFERSSVSAVLSHVPVRSF